MTSVGRQPSSRTNRHDVSPSKVNLLSAPRSVAPGSSRSAAGRSLHGPRRPRRRARCPVPRNPPATCRRPCRTPTHGRRPVRWYSLTPSPGMLATTATATPHSADVTPAVTRGFFAIVRSRPLRFWTATTFGPRLTKLGRLRPALPLVNTSQPDSGSRSPRRPSPAPARWPPARVIPARARRRSASSSPRMRRRATPPETSALMTVGTNRHTGRNRIHGAAKDGNQGQAIIATASAPSTSDAVPLAFREARASPIDPTACCPELMV